MDQFRRAADDHRDDDPRSSAFIPPSIIRESSSAFSKPILPTSSSLLSPKPQFGAPSTNGSSAVGSATDTLTPTATTASSGRGGARYRECLRNHAASLGGHVIDGCGEFMPASPADPLKCAACGCHRSFHRKEPEPEPDNNLRFGCSSSYQVPLLLPPAPTPNPLRFSGNTTDQSSSEERHTSSHNAKSNNHTNNNNNNCNNSEKMSDLAQMSSGDGSRKKRFRTKFSSEQKEKMKAFAERVGWRVQKRDEGEMERFCSEVGVSRQVLKVWMHNNKHLVKNKQDQVLQFDQGTEVKVEGFHVQQQTLHLHHDVV